MTRKRPITWLDQVLERPSEAYATPAEVLRDERLDITAMRAVLQEWDQKARRASMAGAQTPESRDVAAALVELDRREGRVDRF